MAYLIDKFKRNELSGTYWGITTNIDNYRPLKPDALARDNPNVAKVGGLQSQGV